MTTLYFVRHAHSTFTPEELARPLSARGFTDAAAVTEALLSERIDIVVSSPYKRAIQTVEGIAEHLNIEVEIIDGFKERTLTKEPAEDFALAITKVWEDDNFAWEGGESNITAQKRGIEATFQLLEMYKGKNIVIGTHGNIMVLIMNHFNKQYGFSFWQTLDMPDVYKLTFDGHVLSNVTRLWKKQ